MCNDDHRKRDGHFVPPNCVGTLENSVAMETSKTVIHPSYIVHVREKVAEIWEAPVIVEGRRIKW